MVSNSFHVWCYPIVLNWSICRLCAFVIFVLGVAIFSWARFFCDALPLGLFVEMYLVLVPVCTILLPLMTRTWCWSIHIVHVNLQFAIVCMVWYCWCFDASAHFGEVRTYAVKDNNMLVLPLTDWADGTKSQIGSLFVNCNHESC
jgi:hypothetical protein